jgi:MFS family permease
MDGLGEATLATQARSPSHSTMPGTPRIPPIAYPTNEGVARSGRPQIPQTVIALGIVSLLNDLGGDAVTPLLPAFVATIGGGPEALGLIEGVADATASLVQIASGYVADRTGKVKALAFTGYGIANCLRPFLSLTNAWWQILVIRFGDRAGKGVRGTPRDALLADATPAALRGTAYGLHRGMDHAGAFLGPAIAYLMLSHGMSVRGVFAYTAVAGALCLMVLGFFVKDVVRTRSIESLKVGLPESPAFRRFLLSMAIFTLGNSTDAFLLWRARELGIALALAPVLWMVLHLVKSVSSFFGGVLSDSFGRRTAILAGWGLYAGTYAGFALASAAWQIWLLFVVYGVFYGLTESPQSALVVDLVEKDWRGRALGAYNAVIGLALLPASAIFGLLYQTLGVQTAFGTGAALAIFAAVILPSGHAHIAAHEPL